MGIPYGRHYIDEEDIKAVNEVLRSDALTAGKRTFKFERSFARYVKAKYAVSMSSATAALHAACFVAGIHEGDEVITTPITFPATANAILYNGGRPVFADIDPVTYNIEPNKIRELITKKTKAILPVHFTGQPCDMDEIMKIAKENDLVVIQDAAHALGATYKGKMIGSIPDMTVFSFHPVKHITTGEGGMITTNNSAFYEKLLSFRSHGMLHDVRRMQKNEGGWYYEQQMLGFNYRMNEFQAALGTSQLKKIDLFLKRRLEIIQKYNEAFKNNEEIITPVISKKYTNTWHLYAIQLKTKNRKEVYDKMVEAGINVNVHYIPVYKHPYYQNIGYKDVCCENAEQFYQRELTLPVFYQLTDEQQDFIIKTINSILSE